MPTPPAASAPGTAVGLRLTTVRSSAQQADGVRSCATGSSSKAQTLTTGPSARRYASSCRCAHLLLLFTLFSTNFNKFLSFRRHNLPAHIEQPRNRTSNVKARLAAHVNESSRRKLVLRSLHVLGLRSADHPSVRARAYTHGVAVRMVRSLPPCFRIHNRYLPEHVFKSDSSCALASAHRSFVSAVAQHWGYRLTDADLKAHAAKQARKG